jgi:hypothetical protein
METDDRTRSTDVPQPRVLAAGTVATAWLVAVGVDLMFNAGLFSPLFDQAREPSLLDDATLFRRIPVAYLALLMGVVGLAWLLDRTDRRGTGRGLSLGAMAGAVTAALGVIALWTVVDITAGFVAAAVVVQVTQFAAAGAVLGAYRGTSNRRRVMWWALGVTVLAVAAALLTQNLLNGVD